ncbi:MAG: hypothetical protein HKN68_09680 [Saprospiraceae bacterium]|nr:hypothetical protein [Saprospiraceae bacterium]
MHKLKYWIENKRFTKNSIHVFNKAHNALAREGIFYWPEFGTLLGIHRDGKLIGHDTDLDFGIFLSDFNERIESALLEEGFTKEREFVIEGGAYGREESYILKGVTVDLFYFTKTDSGMYAHLFPINENREHIIRELWTSANEFKQIEWEGMKLNIPKETDQRLIDTYGEDYRIPVKDWYTPDDALNSKIIIKKIKHTIF